MTGASNTTKELHRLVMQLIKPAGCSSQVYVVKYACYHLFPEQLKNVLVFELTDVDNWSTFLIDPRLC